MKKKLEFLEKKFLEHPENSRPEMINNINMKCSECGHIRLCVGDFIIICDHCLQVKS